MLDFIRYEYSMMSWKNKLLLVGIFALLSILWIYLPRHKANYRAKRQQIESAYPLEAKGYVLFIRKLYRPAGDDGLIRFNGHEIHYRFDLADRCLDNNSGYIPKNPDPQINRQLRAIEAGRKDIIVKYQADNPQNNLVKLIY